MDIYYYCSYTGSPVGFILGKLSNAHEVEEPLALSGEKIEPLIRNCFELGMVRSACGLLTQAPKRYFLLFKKLVARGGRDELDYYLNIAFVTENQQQYLQWLDEDNTITEDAIAQAGRETILVDRESDFGYKVSGKSLEVLTKMKFGSLLRKCRVAAREDGLYFELASHDADTDEVMQALGISSEERDLELISEDGNWVRVIKKKAKLSRIPILILILLAAVILLVWSKL